MNNRTPFWDMIAWSEIGPELLQVSDDGYNVLVGSTFTQPLLFTDYSAHPKIHNRGMNSDAAGRGQFMGKYWDFYKQTLGLADFGKGSQFLWFWQLVKECEAVDDIDAGRIEPAIIKCKSRWASLPGAGYGQHEQHMHDLIEAYRQAGGSVA